MLVEWNSQMMVMVKVVGVYECCNHTPLISVFRMAIYWKTNEVHCVMNVLSS